MPGRDDRIARELARHLLRVRRLRGVMLWQEERLWLLSRPASRPPEPDELAAALLAPRLPHRQRLAGLVGAREVLPVTGATVAKATYHLKQLRRSRRLHELVDLGARPLRGYRRIDLDGLLERVEASVASMAACLAPDGPGAAQALDDDGSVAEEELPPGPRRARARLGPLAHRITLLYGEALARRATEELMRPWRGQPTRASRARRLAAFARVIADHQRGARHAPLDDAEAALRLGLKRLPRLRALAARALVQLFLDWVERRGGLEGHLPPRRRLIRRAGIALAEDLATAARALVDEVAGEAPERVTEPASSWMRAALALHLAHPVQPVRAPVGPVKRLTSLRAAWQAVPGEHAARLWPALLACDPKTLERCPEELLRGAIAPPAVVERMLRLGLVLRSELWDMPQRLPGYLDAVEAVRRAAPEIEVEARWFRAIFHGPGWGPALVLALLSRARGERSLTLLHALAQALPRERALGEALARWHTFRVTDPPVALPELAAALELPEETLVEYLHHRRLAGQGETFSAALLDLLVVDAARRPRAARRARRRLQRSLELLRRESLRAVLQQALRMTLTRLVGELPLGPLPEGLVGALDLFHAPRIDRALLVGFLRDCIDGRPLAGREANQAWLRRAGEAGLDRARWLAGLHEMIDHRGERLALDTEHDALHALQMGSYFDTCLGLEQGENAASTLLNALDVNKQVLYLRRADGAVVGRKLIGATAEGRLAGYRTYLSLEDGERLRAKVDRAVARYGAACGLRPSDSATPERLHDGFWYDDGNEPWPAAALSGDLPPGLPADRAARREWLFTRGFAGDPAERRRALQELAAGGPYGWRRAATLRLCLMPEVPDPPTPYWDTVQLLNLWAGERWVDERPDRAPYDRLSDALEALPPSVSAVERVARLARALTRRRPEPGTYCAHDGLVAPPGTAALAGPARLLELCRDSLRLAEGPCRECLEEHVDCVSRWRADWVELLVVAALRNGEGEPLVRVLSRRGQHLRAIAIRVCQAVRLPSLAEPLRRALRGASDEELPELALALGTQGEERDRWRLETLLGQQPESLRLAAALHRCGARERALELWQPGARLVSRARRPGWAELVTELGAPMPRWLVEALTRSPEDADLRRLRACFAPDDERAPVTAPVREVLWRTVIDREAAPADRSTAVKRLLEEVHPFRRPDRAALILAAVGGDASHLPADSCHLLAREALACLSEAGRSNADPAHGAAVIRLLTGVPDGPPPEWLKQVDPRSPLLWLGLELGRADEAAALRAFLEGATGWPVGSALWQALDAVLGWLPPALAEPLVHQVLSRLERREHLPALCLELLLGENAGVFEGEQEAERSASYRLQRMVLQLVATLPPDRRAAVAQRVADSGHPRAAWYLGVLEPC